MRTIIIFIREFAKGKKVLKFVLNKIVQYRLIFFFKLDNVLNI